MRFAIREPINALTHFCGVIMSVVGMMVLLVSSLHSGSGVKVASAIIFGLGMVSLYTASTVYHWHINSKDVLEVLRRIDHMMIFAFIAATYTPICLIILNNSTGYVLLSAMWMITILGVVMKMFWMDAPRWVSTGIYMAMGGAALFIIHPLAQKMPMGGLIMLLIGGVFYKIGGIIYGIKPNIRFGKFGYHEIFHIYILLGSLFHFLMIKFYIIG